MIVSSEVSYEKLETEIFKASLDKVNVWAGRAIRVGDDGAADKLMAEFLRIGCWLWGLDVNSFVDIQNLILVSNPLKAPRSWPLLSHPQVVTSSSTWS